MQDHAAVEAERVIEAACKHYRIEEDELLEKKYGDKRRATDAWRIWTETSVVHQWLADRMRLSSRANASNMVRLFEASRERDLTKEVRKWKNL